MSTNASVVCQAKTRTFQLILKEPVGQLTYVNDATFSVLATATGVATSARGVDHAKSNETRCTSNLAYGYDV